MDVFLCPGAGARIGAALVVAIAAVHRLSADRSERDLGGHAAAVAGHADHLPVAASAVPLARSLPLVTAVLASLRLIGESTLCVEGLFVLAEKELAAAVCTVERFVVESVHEPLIS